MNRSKGVNRLFLCMVLFIITAPYGLAFFFKELTLYQSLALSQLLFFVPVLVYLVCIRGRILEEMQVKLLSAPVVLLLVLFGILILPVTTWLNLFSLLFSTNQVAAGLEGAGSYSFWRNLLYIAIVPAVSEEFMFRGIFFHGYRKAGILKAALVSGLCFGLLHLNLNQFVYAFVLGVIFALVVEATGSVTASMIPHFVVNCSSVFSMMMLEVLEQSGAAELTEEVSVTSQQVIAVLGVYTVIALVSGGLAAGVFVWITRLSGRTEHMHGVLHRADEPERPDRRTKSVRAEWQVYRPTGEGCSETEEWKPYRPTGEGRGEMEEWQPYRTSEEAHGEAEEWQEREAEQAGRRRPGGIITPCLAVAVVIAAAYMILTEYFV